MTKHNRYLADEVKLLTHGQHKMAFISGPRQAGKTTFAKMLLNERNSDQYYSWDERKSRQAWIKSPSSSLNTGDVKTTPLIVLDEILKAPQWKCNLRGLYDTVNSSVDILVTASAQLNVPSRRKDSLFGRYHHFRLHPFSLAEVTGRSASFDLNTCVEQSLLHPETTQNASAAEYDALWSFGPFPEPLFSGEAHTLSLWHRERIERIIDDDLRDISQVRELNPASTLAAILPDRAAGTLNVNALRKDLEVAHSTMQSRLELLKQVYYIFEIKPYHHNIPRALIKEGKLYLWDWSTIEDPVARFENLIASHLLKLADYLTDTGLSQVDVRYIKNRQKQSIDFLLVKDGQPWLPIEAKQSQTSPSQKWSYFLKHLGLDFGIQVINKPNIYKIVQVNGGQVLVISADQLLSKLI